MQFAREHKGFKKVGHILGCKIGDNQFRHIQAHANVFSRCHGFSQESPLIQQFHS